MRSAIVCVWLVVSVAWHSFARADVVIEPGDPTVGARGTLCHGPDSLGFMDDDGRCVTGWDGIGEPPDASVQWIFPPPAPPVSTTREERTVHVALPTWVYASLGGGLVLGVALIGWRAMRKRPD